jgi:hypothetical protein
LAAIDKAQKDGWSEMGWDRYLADFADERKAA